MMGGRKMEIFGKTFQYRTQLAEMLWKARKNWGKRKDANRFSWNMHPVIGRC